MCIFKRSQKDFNAASGGNHIMESWGHLPAVALMTHWASQGVFTNILEEKVICMGTFVMLNQNVRKMGVRMKERTEVTILGAK